MVDYRRANVAGGCFFFTVTLAQRDASLLTDHAKHLGNCFRSVRKRHPYTMDACVVLPDHLHCFWTLPENDADFSVRWFLIKSAFSRGLKKKRAAPRQSHETRRAWRLATKILGACDSR